MKKVLMGIDIGTSGTKTILMGLDGAVLASSLAEYPVYTPKPAWSEQDPSDWWKAAVETVKDVLIKLPDAQVLGVSLSGQMHGMVALDKQMQPVRRAILWNDQRTQEACDQIVEASGGLNGLLGYTNNGMLTGYTAGKIVWMKNEEPDNYRRTVLVLNPKDYIRFLMTGEAYTEVSDASGTGLFDVEHRRFSEPLLDKLSMPRSLFAECLESTDIAGKTNAEFEKLTGLPAGTPVASGGGDAVIQTTGMGLVTPGVLGVILGTSGVVAMGLDSFYKNNGQIQLFCNNAANLWHAMGVTLAAGGSFRWVRDQLCREECLEAEKQGVDPYTLMTAEAAKAEAGSEGLFFLPYLSGERCPWADPNARGTYIGLHMRHTKAHLIRAALEGITYSLRQAAACIDGLDPNLKVDKVIVSGGGARSELWRQIVADVFGATATTVSGAAEGGAYGACLVAGVGCGVWKDLDEAVGILREETRLEPNKEMQEIYRRAFGVYDGMYGALKPVFDRIQTLS